LDGTADSLYRGASIIVNREVQTLSMTTRDAVSQTDEELFARYQGGDHVAFAILFERQKGPLYTFCLRMLGDPDRANDAFQDTFARVVQYRASYQSAKIFRGWLFTIARNVCYAAYGRDWKFESLDDLDGEQIGVPIDNDIDVTERELLAEALGRLSAPLREALLLYEYEGFSYEEIATMTGGSLSAIKVRIHRARKLLREMLEPVLRSRQS